MARSSKRIKVNLKLSVIDSEQLKKIALKHNGDLVVEEILFYGSNMQLRHQYAFETHENLRSFLDDVSNNFKKVSKI